MMQTKLKPFFYLGIFYLLVSLILRIIFIFHPITNADFALFESLKIVAVGLLSDILVFTLASSLLALYFLFLSNSKYRKPYGYIIFGLLMTAFIYTAFVPGNIFRQYGGAFPEVATALIGLKTLLFGLMLFLPVQRLKIRNILYFITLFLYVVLIIFNAVSEYFFWNEFGVRYNFIAVDYLIYTNEVIGNIMESYPVLPLFSVIFILAAAVTWFIFRRTKDELIELPNFKQKLILLGSFVLLCGMSLVLIPKLNEVKTGNTFAQEIQANGFPKFFNAFTQKELDYFQFYPTLNESVAEQRFLREFKSASLSRIITSPKPELKKNVVLISIESLSADFLAHYGNTQNITPFLDSLATKSLMFTNLYATGNRTVRGLEALTLCIPPTAGESIIKRKNN
ncbi:MAG: sulfatase-like hydrolase/transferase, partial [Chryseobacterium sp.]|nr:sulfatase-like hydrolase/transferase [Chryseobacterium sp.]